MHLLSPLALDALTKLGIAMFLGIVIGAERIIANKTAGMRTYALVSMGSALFVVVSEIMSLQYFHLGITGIDPLHIPAQIVVGIGFLSVGLTAWKGSSSYRSHFGLTTVTGLWVSAAIGMACGFGLYDIAFIATLLTLFIFVILWFIEQQVKHFVPDTGDTPDSQRENEL